MALPLPSDIIPGRSLKNVNTCWFPYHVSKNMTCSYESNVGDCYSINNAKYLSLEMVEFTVW